MYTEELDNLINRGIDLYSKAMEDGIAPEIARLFLPSYGMYVRWRWTVSLQGALTFLEQRLKHDAQVEIQQYAKAVEELLEPHFHASISAFRAYH